MNPNSDHANAAAVVLIFAVSAAVLVNIFRARRGKELFLRRIPGLNAVDEAAGRATEMGRPVLFSIGLGGADSILVLTAMSVMQHVGRICARMGARIIVPVDGPSAYPLAQEAIREVYESEGRPEAFRADDVKYLTGGQFAWAMATMGLMTRENVASSFYFGSYGAESLMLAETGYQVGAIQVAGTPDLFQVPFFVAACDYTVFGEEFFAASAYLSREPTMVGSLVGQDIGKMVFLAVAIIGMILATLVDANIIQQNYLAVLLGK